MIDLTAHAELNSKHIELLILRPFIAAIGIFYEKQYSYYYPNNLLIKQLIDLNSMEFIRRDKLYEL